MADFLSAASSALLLLSLLLLFPIYRIKSLTLDTDEAGPEKSRQIFRTRMSDVERLIWNVKLTSTTP